MMKRKSKKGINLFKMGNLLVTAIFLSIIGTGFNLILPIYVQRFIDLKDKFKLTSHIVFPIVFLLLCASIINAISSYLISWSGDRRIKQIRNNIEKKLLDLPISFYKNTSSGEIVSRVINDSLIIKEFTTTELPSAVISLVTLVGSILILLYLDIKLTLVILISFALVSLIAYPLGKINEKYAFSIQSHLGNLSQMISENVLNIKVIKLYNAQNEVRSTFKNENEKIYRLSKRIDKIFSITGPVQTAFTILAFLVIILYGSSRVSNHTLSMGVLASFLMYIFEIITPINTLANFYVSYSEAKGASKVINRIMNEENEKIEGISFDKKSMAKLEMNNIYFHYTDDNKVLENVNLYFNPFEKVAIVGPSGAGKTTLINILTRLQDNYEGQVLLDQISSKEIALSNWRSLFSVVTQENSVFSGTIKTNLTLGLKDNPSEKDIRKALSIATLENDVNKNPDGLNFEVGEGGSNLSGGQRQKIQIARAYLKNTPFIIFDEATSNLDPESEADVLKSLDNLAKERTLIVIAHRLSTIVNADRIYFLDDHKIIGSGSHKELLKFIPKYKTFVEDQFISKGE